MYVVLVVYASWTGRMGLEHSVCNYCGSTRGAVSCVGFLFFSPSFYVSVDVRWVVASVVDSGCCDAYNGGRNLCVAQGFFLVFDERRTRLFSRFKAKHICTTTLCALFITSAQHKLRRFLSVYFLCLSTSLNKFVPSVIVHQGASRM